MEDVLIKREQLLDVLTPLRKREPVSDYDFDRIYSPVIRRLSIKHWTPVEVAIQAAKHLVRKPKTRVLDVGSGVGKFCFIGALTTPGIFVGVEQRRHLIDEAERVRDAFELARINFIHGNMIDVDWSAFDAFYLYNPFYENMDALSSIDDSVPLGFEYYQAYVNTVRKKLRVLPIGTKVATYHGFGGKMPDCYELKVKERIGNDCLYVWIKTKNIKLMSEVELAALDLIEWKLAIEG